MAKNYKEHYEEAQRIYTSKEPIVGKHALSDINVTVIRPDVEHPIIKLPANYMQLIDQIHEDMKHKMKDKKRLFFEPKVKPEDNVVRMLNDHEALQVKGAEELCEAILPQIEAYYYKSYLHAEKCYFYRNIVTNKPARTSWLWHYDNHPVETHKMIVYLTAVEEDSGPFEYLQDTNGKGIIVYPSRTGLDNWGPPKWKGSRVPPDVVNDYCDKGCKRVKVIGPKGTILLFDDNVIHKANIGKVGHRDVFAVQFRPAKTKMRPYLHPKWTGSYEANDIIKDPDIIRPTAKFGK